jgi:hypothetical protein
VSFPNRNPFAGYALLLWCRGCGHFSVRAANPAQSIPMVASRAHCRKCGGRSIGVRQFHASDLHDSVKFEGWQLRMLARACDKAAEESYCQSDGIPPATYDDKKLKLYKEGSTYTEIAGALWLQVHARERKNGSEDGG